VTECSTTNGKLSASRNPILTSVLFGGALGIPSEGATISGVFGALVGCTEAVVSAAVRRAEAVLEGEDEEAVIKAVGNHAVCEILVEVATEDSLVLPTVPFFISLVV
jgi:hypothetical protein